MKMFKQYLALFLSISLIFSNTLTSLAVTERTKHLDGIELDNVATPSDAVRPSDSDNSGDNLDSDDDIELDDASDSEIDFGDIKASDSNANRHIDGKWYYFNEGSSNSKWSIDEASGIWVATSSENARPYGSMYINEITPDGNRVDENGALIK